MKFKIGLLGIVALAVAACGGVKKDNRVTVIDGFAQGGTYHIVIKSDRPVDLKGQVDSLLREIDNSMSLFNPDSRLSRLNRNETDSVDAFIADCIAEAERLSRETDGAYDITVKPLTAAYGFAGDSVVQQPNVDSLLRFVGYRKIAVDGGRLWKEDPRMQLDLNSIAQGATSDYIAAYFDSLGLTDYIVEVGGEIFCRGSNAEGKPWRVGIDRPAEGNVLPGADLETVIGLSGQGLATSGNYRKFYTDDKGRKIVHTINARTGEPIISNLLSVTVVGPTATLADAYGTVCMILGLEKSKEFLAGHPELHAYLIYSDDRGNYQTYLTPGMEAMIARQASTRQ